MNETELALEYLEPISKHPVMSGAYCEHLKTAIIALREQVERSKGCEHRRGWDSRCGANYCPMCGRELDERPEEDEEEDELL